MKARHFRWVRLGALGLLWLVGCTPQAGVATSQAQIPPVEPGMARVWIFRQADLPGGNVYAADPIVTRMVHRLAKSSREPPFFTISRLESTDLRYSLMEPPLASTTPSSWRRGCRLTCRSNGNPTGKRTAPEVVAALPC